MPVYDFRCRKCGRESEVAHAMGAPHPTVCPECGGELDRVFHPVGITYRCSGFYHTDKVLSEPTEDDLYP